MSEPLNIGPGEKVEINTPAGLVTIEVEAVGDPNVIIDFYEAVRLSSDRYYVVIIPDPERHGHTPDDA